VSWAQAKVRQILLNCNYVGQVRHYIRDKEREYSGEGLHDPIIPQELFDTAQRLLEKNRQISPHKKPNADKYFTGFLVCARCGHKLRSYTAKRTAENGAVYYSRGYRCANKSVQTCGMGSIVHGKIEKAFEDYIAQVSAFDVANEIKQAEFEQKRQDHLALIDSYEKKRRQLEEKEREALTLYVNNDIDFDNYREIKKRVDKDKQLTHAELTRLRDVPEEVTVNQEDIINQLSENWEWLSGEERRQFLMQFAERIVIDIEKETGQHLGTARIVDVVFT